ncbi:copper-containing nitrite reductase [Solirhodobacter olei]|uniref:copper-containing nitrite reductase n=1 Tax=Solirhodobacter olei TaxID=2493082 RepID=UPI000FDB3250|nr:copper-containing nitrite reductase [Solirhodobacter olei]
MAIHSTETACNAGRRAFLTAGATASAMAGIVLAGAPGKALAETASAAPPAADPLGIPTDKINISTLPREKQTLVAPPAVPDHEQVATGGPKIVEVTMTVHEKKMQIDDDGTEIWALTFNGSVPGPMIVCHQGDYIELTLRNAAENVFEHNVDFHASTGALGGGALTKVSPGEEVKLRFRALEAGVFVYHCAPGDIMVPYHVTHGMNGAVMVLPRDGLKKPDGSALRYDRAFYIGEQDFYIPRDKDGAYKSYASAGEDMADWMDVARTLTPTHVVFNGRVGSLAGKNAMQAKVGETVLIVHAQANRDTRPHLIGGHGDYVWETGKFANPPQVDQETWFIRGGSAGAAACTFLQPGVYAYLNHNLIEAFMLGAVARFKVEGKWDDRIMAQIGKPTAA